MFFNADATSAYYLRSKGIQIYDVGSDQSTGSATSGNAERRENPYPHQREFTADPYECNDHGDLPLQRKNVTAQHTANVEALDKGVDDECYTGGLGWSLRPFSHARPPVGASAPRHFSYSVTTESASAGSSGANLFSRIRSREYAPGTLGSAPWTQPTFPPRLSGHSLATAAQSSPSSVGGTPSYYRDLFRPSRSPDATGRAGAHAICPPDVMRGNSVSSGSRGGLYRTSSTPNNYLRARAAFNASASAGLLPVVNLLSLYDGANGSSRSALQNFFTPPVQQRRAPVASTPPLPLSAYTSIRRASEGQVDVCSEEADAPARPLLLLPMSTPDVHSTHELRDRYTATIQNNIITEEGPCANVFAVPTNDLSEHGGDSQNVASTRYLRVHRTPTSQEGSTRLSSDLNVMEKCWAETENAGTELGVASAAPQNKTRYSDEDYLAAAAAGKQDQREVDTTDLDGTPRTPWWTVDVSLTFLTDYYNSPSEEAEAMLAAATTRPLGDMPVVGSVRCRAPLLPANASPEEAWEMTQSFLRRAALSAVEGIASEEFPCVPQAYYYYDTDFSEYVQLNADTLSFASTRIRAVMVAPSTESNASKELAWEGREPSPLPFYPRHQSHARFSPPAMTATTPLHPQQGWMAPSESSCPHSREPNGSMGRRRPPFDSDLKERSREPISQSRQQRQQQPHAATGSTHATLHDRAPLYKHDILNEVGERRKDAYDECDAPRQEYVCEQQQRQIQSPAAVWHTSQNLYEGLPEKEGEGGSTGVGVAAAVLLQRRSFTAPCNVAPQCAPARCLPSMPVALSTGHGSFWDTPSRRAESTAAAAGTLRPSPPAQQKRAASQYFDDVALQHSSASFLRPTPPPAPCPHKGSMDSAASRDASQGSVLTPTPPRSSQLQHAGYRPYIHPYFDEPLSSLQSAPHVGASFSSYQPEALDILLRRSAEATRGKSHGASLHSEQGAHVYGVEERVSGEAVSITRAAATAQVGGSPSLQSTPRLPSPPGLQMHGGVEESVYSAMGKAGRLASPANDATSMGIALTNEQREDAMGVESTVVAGAGDLLGAAVTTPGENAGEVHPNEGAAAQRAQAETAAVPVETTPPTPQIIAVGRLLQLTHATNVNDVAADGAGRPSSVAAGPSNDETKALPLAQVPGMAEEKAMKAAAAPLGGSEVEEEPSDDDEPVDACLDMMPESLGTLLYTSSDAATTALLHGSAESRQAGLAEVDSMVDAAAHVCTADSAASSLTASDDERKSKNHASNHTESAEATVSDGAAHTSVMPADADDAVAEVEGGSPEEKGGGANYVETAASVRFVSGHEETGGNRLTAPAPADARERAVGEQHTEEAPHASPPRAGEEETAGSLVALSGADAAAAEAVKQASEGGAAAVPVDDAEATAAATGSSCEEVVGERRGQTGPKDVANVVSAPGEDAAEGGQQPLMEAAVKGSSMDRTDAAAVSGGLTGALQHPNEEASPAHSPMIFTSPLQRMDTYVDGSVPADDGYSGVESPQRRDEGHEGPIGMQETPPTGLAAAQRGDTAGVGEGKGIADVEGGANAGEVDTPASEYASSDRCKGEIAGSQELPYHASLTADQLDETAVIGVSMNGTVAPSIEEEPSSKELDAVGVAEVNHATPASLGSDRVNDQDKHYELSEGAEAADGVSTVEGSAHGRRVEMTAADDTTEAPETASQDEKKDCATAPGAEQKVVMQAHTPVADQAEELALAHATGNATDSTTVDNSPAEPTPAVAVTTIKGSKGSYRKQRAASLKHGQMDHYSGMVDLNSASAVHLTQLQDDVDAPPMFQRSGVNTAAAVAISTSAAMASISTRHNSGVGILNWPSADTLQRKVDSTAAARADDEADKSSQLNTTVTTRGNDNEDVMMDAPMNVLRDSTSATHTPTLARREEEEGQEEEDTSMVEITSTGDAADMQVHIACSYTSVSSDRASAAVNAPATKEAAAAMQRSEAREAEMRSGNESGAVPPAASSRPPLPRTASTREGEKHHFRHSTAEKFWGGSSEPISTGAATHEEGPIEVVPLVQTSVTATTGPDKVLPPHQDCQVKTLDGARSSPLVGFDDGVGLRHPHASPPQQQAQPQPISSSEMDALPPLSSKSLQTPAPPRNEHAMRKTMVLLGFPGSIWEYIMANHYEPMHEAFVTDAATAAGVPQSSIQDVRYTKGSLMVDFYVLHPSSIDEQRVRDRMCSYEYPHMWVLYEEKKRERKRLLHGGDSSTQHSSSPQAVLSAVEEVKWSPCV
ncbi:hypothetical protein ABL78_6072 [Leptomonas seymouri]|uniref:Flagellar attachment zone protein 1 conserved domain-containing protein n=1 Tax=Leptomonas seymouri TaxID=5684 RepID=A0A0N0P4I6_LEPSE|nr:hypothetical protein ABL78_6072 [Leptomonas seymouri]|eukprot:KPI84867.1 hypothetical protein ABL78_6072 [Leptomonas seymouri]